MEGSRLPFTKIGGVPQSVEYRSQNTRDTKLSYGENLHLVLERYQDVKDRQTDRQTELP